VFSNWQINAAPLAPVMRVAIVDINATYDVFVAKQPAQKFSHLITFSIKLRASGFWPRSHP
jgi:hypothetical protein